MRRVLIHESSVLSAATALSLVTQRVHRVDDRCSSGCAKRTKFKGGSGDVFRDELAVDQGLFDPPVASESFSLDHESWIKINARGNAEDKKYLLVFLAEGTNHCS